MENLPINISLVFGATTILTIVLFYKAALNSKVTLTVLLVWATLQSIISITGFYTDTATMPPKILLAIAPPLLLIILLLNTTSGKQFLDKLDPAMLTFMHIVRVPVELVLFWLATYKTIPDLMTFEGRNFDIISGFTAPVIYYFGYVKNIISRKGLIIWNVICLMLLINIITYAVLSAPLPIQQFAHEQPNIAVTYFPFILLPSLVVPLVLIAHIAVLRKLLLANSN